MNLLKKKKPPQGCLCEGQEAHFIYINRAPWLCHQQQKRLPSASVTCGAHQVHSGMWSLSLTPHSPGCLGSCIILGFHLLRDRLSWVFIHELEDGS